ncbi:MAG: hypothetical protein AB7E85_09440 [Pseudobdellovibrionaceae bacterium]
MLKLRQSALVLLALTATSCAGNEANTVPLLSFENYPPMTLSIGGIDTQAIAAADKSNPESISQFPERPAEVWRTYLSRRFTTDPNQSGLLSFAFDSIDASAVENKETDPNFAEKMAQPFTGTTDYTLKGVLRMTTSNCNVTGHGRSQTVSFSKMQTIPNYISLNERDMRILRMYEEMMNQLDPVVSQVAQDMASACTQ